MKPLARKLLATAVTCLLAATCSTTLHSQNEGIPAPVDTPPPLGVATPIPTPHASPASSAKPDGKPVKGSKGSRDPSRPPRVRAIKEIPFPLTIGSDATNLKIPEVNAVGQLISLLMSAKTHRIDNEHVQMEEMKMDLFHADGKEDFHIILPASIFNLKTHIIASEQPVTVRTEDFELTGERMEFNTLDRTGELSGHVHMIIHNLKQVASVPDPSAASK